jgi:hypothetical protein
MEKTIEAVIEIARFEGVAPWPTTSEYAGAYLPIFPGLSSEEIGSLVITACLYNQAEIHPDGAETLRAFMATAKARDGFVLPGGLRFKEGGQVKIIPGCCCGLENWREWLDVPHGKKYLWAGHNPSPWCEYFDNHIRIWQDEKEEGVDSIEFEIPEMEVLLEGVERDLLGFLAILKKWVAYVSPGLEADFVAYFAENMNIA